MQVHTINMIFPIEENDISYMQHKYGIEIRQVNDFHEDFKFATFSIYKQPIGKHYLSIFIDCILLLGKVDMVEADYFEIKKEVKGLLTMLFGNDDHYDLHVLKRIDYKIDVFMPKEKERQLLLYLYGKITKSFRHQKKVNRATKNNKIFTAYDLQEQDGQAKVEFEEQVLTANDDDDEGVEAYETTIYHESKSVRVIVYDKEEERKAKSALAAIYEKGVMRFEVAVLQRHIHYRRNKKHCPLPLKSQLSSYFKEEMWFEYLNFNLLPIYLNGDFFKISEAKKKISDSNEKPASQRKLIEYLTMISRGNIDTPQKKGLNPKTIRSRNKKLESLGINPIPIPQNYKSSSKLENPLKCIYEDRNQLKVISGDMVTNHFKIGQYDE